MSKGELQYFVSYAREDTEFVLKLAKELRAVGVYLWLDQLDILGGQRWDHAVEEALETCQGMIAVLSHDSLASNNVMDEVSYALDEGKLVVPVLFRQCDIPFRLRRVQHINFTADYDTGFRQLLRALRVEHASQRPKPAAPDRPVVQHATVPSVAKRDKPTAHREETNEQEMNWTAPPSDLPRGTVTHPAAPERMIWIPVLLTVIGWAVGGAIGLAVVFNIAGAFGKAFGGAIGWAMGGTIGSFTLGHALRLIEPSIRREQIIIFTTGWAIGGAIGGVLSWEFPSVAGGIIGGVAGGSIGGLITGYHLRLIKPSIQWTQVSMIAFSWATGGGLGSVLSWAFLGYQYTTIFYAIIGAITGAIIGAVGGGLMFCWLSYERRTV